MTALRRQQLASFALTWVLGLAAGVGPAGAQIAPPPTPTTVTVIGGAAGETRRLPAGQAEFGIRIPLRPNAENVVTVTATNDQGQRVSKDSAITQITLGDIVRAQVTAQRLTTQEVKALVADGVIDIKDPANFNVSIFIIVLTIGGQPAQVSVPVVTPKQEPLGFGEPVTIGCSQSGELKTTERAIAIPCGDGGGGGGATPTIQIIPFEMDAPDAPVEARVPGVIVIEGRIKTLKEFFRVNLLLMNVSALFNLQNITARLEVPEGALTHVAPASGTVSIADIAPGGENKGEFIVRGDRIGTHTVTAHFGAELVAPFLPKPIAISGSASTDLEVKGPPKLAVTVEHPNWVQAGEIYDLVVHIENEDEELDALYTTFELDVGVDAQLVDEVTGEPLDGPAVHELGDILRKQHATRRFKVRPKKTGPISSCTAGTTENIHLSVVFTGPGGGPNCAVGTLPSTMVSPDGRPAVTVIPTHNTTGVGINAAVVALFSAPMITETITAGFEGASFRLIDPAGAVVPGVLQFGAVFGGTVATFRPAAPLVQNAEYTIVVEEAIFNEDGLALASGMTARFQTEGAIPAPDTDAPTGTIVIEPPIDPQAVVKGQLVPVVVHSADNIAVTRVDLMLNGELVDTKRPNSPVRFLVDTSALALGSAHTISARLRDEAGNERTLVASLRVAGDLNPPSVAIEAPGAVARGRSLPVLVHADDDGRVDKVELFLDGANTSTNSLMVAPFAFSVATANLGAGPHTARAVAVDGAGNRAETLHAFTVTNDVAPPAIAFLSPVAGTELRPGIPVAVVTTASDDIGVASVEVFLDAELAPRSTGIAGFNLVTIGLPAGAHRLRAVARDLSGNSTTTETLFLLVEPVHDVTPPAALALHNLSLSVPVNGVVLVTGLDGAAEPGARVEIANAETQAATQAAASAHGAFSAQIEGSGGQSLDLAAIDAAGNRGPSVRMEIPRPAALTSIAVAPASVTLDRALTAKQIVVTGTFSDNTQRLVSGPDVVFASLAPAIAGVSATGLVLPGTNGVTTVRVSAAGVTPVEVPVTVAIPAIVGVDVAPTTLTLNDVGRTQRLMLTARYSDGVTQAYSGAVAFASQAPGVATVDSAGLVTGVGEGNTVINVAPAGLPVAQVAVSVRRKALTSIAVSPVSVSLIGAGATQALTVTGIYSDSTVAVITGGIAFTSRDAAVASVAATAAGGTVLAHANGATTIDVVVPGVPPVAVPVVVKSLTSISLAPNAFTLIGAAKTQQLSVVGTYSDGSTIDSPSGVTFETTGAAVATVSTSGLVTTTGIGSATIRARLGALPAAESQVTVIARQAVSVDVTPESHTFVAVGERVTLQVIVHFNDGTVGAPLGQPAFATRNAAVASVSTAGTVEAVANGATLIDVTADAMTAAVNVVVDIPPVNPAPVIDSLDRPRAAEGDRFAIRGRHLGATPEANHVFLDGTPVEVIAARADEIVARVPEGAATGAVTVAVAGQASNAVQLGIYSRRARGTLVTAAIPARPGPVTLVLPDVVVRAGDKVWLSGAPDTLAPLSFTGTLTASVDGGAALSVSPAAAIELTGDVAPGTRTLQFELTGANVSTSAIHLVVGPDATGAIAGQRSVLSVNHSLPTPVTFVNLTGLDNLPLANGTVVAVSTLGGCNHRDRGGNCLNSVGGVIANGAASPTLGDARIRNFVVTNGRIDVLYDPVGTERTVSSEGIATLSVLPTTAGGAVSGATALVNAPITLTSLDSVHAPRSQPAVLADGSAHIVTIDLQDFRDSAGNPVPDVRVAVSTLGGCNHRDRADNCLNSAGGVIANGDASPELSDGRLRTFAIAGDRASVQYSSEGLLLPVPTVGTALVQLLPARPNGTRIGSRSFSETPVTLSSAGASAATLTVTPAAVLADTGDNRVTIVVSGLQDAAGNPVPNGTRVVVATLGGCNHREPDGSCINSAGGVIKNGQASPELGDERMRVLEVTDGKLTAIYSSEGVGLETPQTAIARISFLPAQASGTRIGNAAFIVANVTLSAHGSATTSASPQSVVADGLPKTVTITVTDLRDASGNPVPDGAVVVASTLGGCSHRDASGNCTSSAGGVITNGAASPELGDNRMRTFVVSGGGIVIHYDPQGVQLDAGSTATANVHLIAGQPQNGVRVGNRAFAVVPVALSSATVSPANVSVVPASVLADGGTRQSIVTVTNITDAQGRRVPDGTRVVVSTLGGCSHRDASGNCINSAGGTIDSGSPSPELGDSRMRVHQVVDGAVQVVYNSAPITLGSAASDTAIVQFLPATPAGVRIGNRTFVTAAVTLSGSASADIAGPGAVASGGQGVYTVTNIRDTAGVLLPDGAKVAVATLGGCFHRDQGGSCINSAGGTIGGGDGSPELGDARMRVFTVAGGAITFSFQAPASGTSVLQLLPAAPNGVRIGNRTFAIKTVSITP